MAERFKNRLCVVANSSALLLDFAGEVVAYDDLLLHRRIDLTPCCEPSVECPHFVENPDGSEPTVFFVRAFLSPGALSTASVTLEFYTKEALPSGILSYISSYWHCWIELDQTEESSGITTTFHVQPPYVSHLS
jgi:hypothetical protein